MLHYGAPLRIDVTNHFQGNINVFYRPVQIKIKIKAQEDLTPASSPCAALSCRCSTATRTACANSGAPIRNQQNFNNPRREERPTLQPQLLCKRSAPSRGGSGKLFPPRTHGLFPRIFFFFMGGRGVDLLCFILFKFEGGESSSSTDLQMRTS